MDSILIRNYKLQDYARVNKIFVDGVIENIQNAFYRGLKNQNIIGYITFLTILGLSYSIYYGCIGILVGLCINLSSVTLANMWYLW